MPKLKTHKGAAKRFAVTGSGKIVRRHAFKGHLMIKKSSGRKRRLRGEAVVTGEYAKGLRRQIPHAF